MTRIWLAQVVYAIYLCGVGPWFFGQLVPQQDHSDTLPIGRVSPGWMATGAGEVAVPNWDTYVVSTMYYRINPQKQGNSVLFLQIL